jgi:hypothetical protein
MLVADLSGDAPGLHQARLKSVALLSEAHKHRSGTIADCNHASKKTMPLRSSGGCASAIRGPP